MNIDSLVLLLFEDYESKIVGRYLAIPRSVVSHVDKMSEPMGDTPGYFGKSSLQRNNSITSKIITNLPIEKKKSFFNKFHGRKIL